MRRGVRLGGAVVVVTGASSGIGRAAARGFAARGAHVVLAARSADSLRAAAEECRGCGVRAVAVPMDVCDEGALEGLARRAAEEFGRIDVWVNNAAVMAYGTFEEVPSEVQRRVVDVNLFGVMQGSRVALPYMREQGEGVIINVASLYAKMTSPYVGSYATSKFGILGFSEVLRQELKASRGIHVCTVLPGSVDTPIFHHAANYTGRTAKPPPPVVSPDRVVRAIVRCAEAPRHEVTVGRVHQALSWVHSALPGIYDEVVPHVMRLLVLGRPGRPHTPGNVFAPMPELNAVCGRWRRPGLRFAAAGGAGAALAVGCAGLAKRIRRGGGRAPSPGGRRRPRGVEV